MTYIPPEIFPDILVRLPAESLLRFRSVCKEWLRIIGDSSFIKNHTNIHPYSHTLLVRNTNPSPLLYSFSLDSLKFISGPQMIDATRIKQTMRRGQPLLPHLFGAPLCNGLILVSNFDIDDVWEICNPLTREFHELPEINAADDWCLCGLGFGYDYLADDYIVVRIDQLCLEEFQTLIYSLKLDSWRKIEDCPCSWPCTPRLAAFLNGTFYWRSMDMIIALDLNTESYSQLPLPPVDGSRIRKLILDSLDGCLICSLHYWLTHRIDGWMMKDNGIEKSWVKLFSLQYAYNEELRLVAYLQRKEQVVLQHHSGFLWFDIGNNSIKKFSIHGLPDITTSQIFRGSLVRLDDRAIGAKTKRQTNRTDKRRSYETTTLAVCCEKLEFFQSWAGKRTYIDMILDSHKTVTLGLRILTLLANDLMEADDAVRCHVMMAKTEIVSLDDRVIDGGLRCCCPFCKEKTAAAINLSRKKKIKSLNLPLLVG